jgi:OmcA/MtrC family decaheme c-type cytochrome
MFAVLAIAVLLMSTSSVFAQVQFTHLDVSASPESCVICHSEAGAEHQAVYNDYTDESTLELTIDSVTSIPDGAGAFNATMTFTIKKNGQPYIDADGLPSLEQKRFYAVTYDSATRQFENSKSFSNPVALGNSQYAVTAAGISYDLNNSNGLAYAYIADGPIHTEQPAGSHVHLYDDVASAGLAFGDVATYESVANVSGCEKCHGKPYMKHGYRDPVVTGLSDFSSCKSCHYDTRDGGHQDWQVLVNDPARYAELTAESEATGTRFRDLLTDDEKALYAYKANLKNDVHMAHAMEFPYPQSMSTCATCHEGKLDFTLTDANFKLETCLSCHPVTGPEEGTDPHRAPALANIIPHDISLGECRTCHSTGGIAPLFSEIHTGYDKVIYADAAGTKWAEIFTASIDDVSLNGNILTIKFSATETGNTTALHAADIIPTVMIGLYGYDTKDYIVNPHNRDEDRNRLLEYVVDGETVNPRFTTVSAEGGSWEVTADLSLWTDKIADGIIKRAEIGIMPELVLVVGEVDDDANGEDNDIIVALNAPSRTFDLTANVFDDNYFGDIVDVFNGCNTCHDALATTFHSAKRGGNIRICRMCHAPTNDGSHIELQSRSIDSYVHAIHSFQAFDIGDIDFTDPVETIHYEHHINHVFPNFTIQNCEACHNEGTYNVPDQSRSLPSLHSGTDEVTTMDRQIGNLEPFVTGPASRACGACHRAHRIKDDDVSGLAAFQQHMKAGGYLLEDPDRVDGGTTGKGIWDMVVETVMALFK